VKVTAIVGCSSSVQMLWGFDEESDIVNMWPVGLEVMKEENNLILQEEEAKASLCNDQRKFEKSSHSHCRQDSEMVHIMKNNGRKVLCVN